MYFESRGKASSIKEAIEIFTNGANTMAGIVAVSSNAYVEAMNYELAFEATEKTSEREFFQSLISDKPLPTTDNRNIDKESTVILISAISRHRDAERIMRAVAHYREMLSFWHLEERIRCVATAFIAVEALGEVALQKILDQTGKTKKELAVEMGIDIDKSNLITHVLGRVRREAIFHGDLPTYQKAKHVSDGFEHSFTSFDAIREPANDIVVRAAAHIRQAILELAGIPKSRKEALLAEPFSRPKVPFRLVQYVFGHLIGDGPELAAPDQAYPILQWRYRAEPLLDPETGKVQVRNNVTMQPRIASGIGFRLRRYEI